MIKALSDVPVKYTASGLIRLGKCVFMGFLIGTDGINDPTITIYNNIAASGQEVIPTCTYDASVYGLNGCTGIYQYCDLGLYIEISCAGAVEVVVQAASYYPTGDLKWNG